jgi:malate/lactate dehydrogenase
MCVIKIVIYVTNNAERRTNMSSKITIIGAGSVGATIAYTLSQKSIASEIVLIDINKQKAEGEVMDIDAYTGGFNLQIAWSTAYVAANSI